MEYIVMECRQAYAVLLDSEGRFVKACNKNYETGQYVTDPVLINDSESMLGNIDRIDRRRRMMKYTLAAACVVFVLCFGIFSLFIKTHTSLYIRINPEIRIDINRLGFVTAVEAENEDGDALLSECNIDSKDKLTVCRNIIKFAYDKGYITTGGKIYVYIDSPDEVFRETGEFLSEGLSSFTQGEFSADIEILNISQYDFDDIGETFAETETTERESDSSETATAENETDLIKPSMSQNGSHKEHNGGHNEH